MSPDYALILSTLYAGKEWSTLGNSYDGIDWRDSSPKPSKGELDAAWEQVKVSEALRGVRVERNARLSACDWTQLPDAPVDAADWTAYRQQLRDFPEVCDPLQPEWPSPPE